jgi:asparagine synthase (glutamine-hydrolysing)
VTGYRYIAFVASNTEARTVWDTASAGTLAALVNFEAHHIGVRTSVLCQRGAATTIGAEGLIVGPVFQRGRSEAMTVVDAETERSIVASRGDWLIRAHWGAYVAILESGDGDRVDVIRAPLGDLPCYVLTTASGIFVASDVALLAALAGYRPSIAWAMVARQLVLPDLGGRATCLEGLDELAGGERLRLDDAAPTVEALWSPWSFVARLKRMTDLSEAASRVRGAVQTAVRARASQHGAVLLKLSGGLDSSIVAACLAGGSCPTVALTLVTRDRSGDEREHARSVARYLGIPLVEADRDLGLINIGLSDAAGLPRPSARSFAQASLRIATRVAREHGATAIFDGGGGDQLFCSLQSAAPVADCLHADGGTGHFWATARSIGIAAQTSTLEVARRALIRSWTRGPAFRWPRALTFVSPEGRACGLAGAGHPWLIPPDGTLPGSAAHVALLLAAQSLVETSDPHARLPGIAPLVSQPVAEACLRVPSWCWTRDGHNRVIARDAFRFGLPPATVDRRDKGTPDGFVVELIAANRDRIRALLMDGLLADQGLLDRAAVNAALSPAGHRKVLDNAALMDLVDVEAWARSWHDRGTGWLPGTRL